MYIHKYMLDFLMKKKIQNGLNLYSCKFLFLPWRWIDKVQDYWVLHSDLVRAVPSSAILVSVTSVHIKGWDIVKTELNCDVTSSSSSATRFFKKQAIAVAPLFFKITNISYSAFENSPGAITKRYFVEWSMYFYEKFEGCVDVKFCSTDEQLLQNVFAVKYYSQCL